MSFQNNNKGSTKLIVVRHCETEWNRQGRQQGHLDSPLTENGIKQAQRLATNLMKEKIQCIYSSDLGRTLQTAEIIASELLLPINNDDRLRERNLGILQGLTISQFKREHPQEYSAYNSGNPDYEIPGGESMRNFSTRCVGYCNELVKHHPGKRILIVTHSGVLERLFFFTLDIDLDTPRRFSLFDNAINRFSVSGGTWTLDTWGELSR